VNDRIHWTHRVEITKPYRIPRQIMNYTPKGRRFTGHLEGPNYSIKGRDGTKPQILLLRVIIVDVTLSKFGHRRWFENLH